ncbi:VOC family protein [Paeniglutamicibacter cryotolerans]|uniref:VOC domain-containing protein n=1 Tax=Paeniglutamicibacter cryotolerans TaxID=670079 RepID=A0A839QGL4_9MICC|nr:VOC family protein [Paeniglutamicibacter cryotolerans]MBB2994837.1 hypothetical protein [Paeniglutamicibacter cryotolerans]
MDRMIFVNLPTENLDAANTFYGALGFRRNPDFSNDDASAWEISGSIWLMSLRAEFYGSFMRNGDEPCFGSGKREVMNGLSCTTREEVDALTAAASRNGGSVYRAAEEQFPGMYGSAVLDPDGHAWELIYLEVPQES